jgi:hypothetical protein
VGFRSAHRARDNTRAGAEIDCGGRAGDVGDYFARGFCGERGDMRDFSGCRVRGIRELHVQSLGDYPNAAGPWMAGRWTGIQNGIGSLSGVLAPSLAGLIVQSSGSSKLAFLISGAIALAGAVSWGMVVGPVEEVCWRKQHEPA